MGNHGPLGAQVTLQHVTPLIWASIFFPVERCSWTEKQEVSARSATATLQL